MNWFVFVVGVWQYEVVVVVFQFVVVQVYFDDVDCFVQVGEWFGEGGVVQFFDDLRVVDVEFQYEVFV